MPLVTTEAFDVALLQDAIAGGFDLLTYSPTYYGRFDTNAYQDASQAVPATAYGQHVMQLRDFRETPGGSTYPYLNWGTSGSAPILQPELTPWGGAYYGNLHHQIAALAGVGSNNFSAFLCGVFTHDYINAFVSNGLLSIGGTFATSVFASGVAWGSDNRLCLFGYHNAGPTTMADVSLSFADDVLGIQSSPSGLVYSTNMGSHAALAASTTGTIANGDVGEDARETGNVMWGSVAALVVKSPAWSDGDFAAVRAGLQAAVTLKSLWPSTLNLWIFLGDSLTAGNQTSPVAVANTYPNQALTTLGAGNAKAVAAKSGMRLDQIQAAYLADTLRYVTAMGRPANLCVTVWGGTNDLAAGASAATVLSRLEAICAPLKTAGAKVNVLSCIANNGLTSPQNTERVSFNTSLNSAFPTATAYTRVYAAAGGTTWADTLTDVAANPNLTDPSNATYFSDGTHLTTLGYGQVSGDWQGAANTNV
jgi:lysophospholipase L1-like esterase